MICGGGIGTAICHSVGQYLPLSLLLLDQPLLFRLQTGVGFIAAVRCTGREFTHVDAAIAELRGELLLLDEGLLFITDVGGVAAAPLADVSNADRKQNEA